MKNVLFVLGRLSLMLVTGLVFSTHRSSAETNTPATLGKSDVGIWGVLPWKSPDDLPGSKHAPFSADYYDRVKDVDFGIATVRWPVYSLSQSCMNTTCKNPVDWDQHFRNFRNNIKELNHQIVAAEKMAQGPNPVMRKALFEIDFLDSGENVCANCKLKPIGVYKRRISYILEYLKWNSPNVVGISLSEENVGATAGRARLLADLYTYVHKKFPGLKIYQWYNPNTETPIVGLKAQADGWIFDPYTLSPEVYPLPAYAYLGLGTDPYQTILNKYLATGKPVVMVIYASTFHSAYYRPKENRWGLDMREVMKHQFAANQAAGIPTAFYWTDFNEEKKINSIHFCRDDSARSKSDSELIKEIDEMVEDFIETAHRK